MTERHIQINAEDVPKVEAIIKDDWPYKVIRSKLIDEVFHPVPSKKVVYQAPPGKALLILLNPAASCGLPRNTNANDWYTEKFKNAGIKFEWVKVAYL